MSNFARSFDSSKFNFESNTFEDEKDTARAIFYYEEKAVGDKLEKREMVTIRSPGENLGIYGGPVREIDKVRFAKTYEAFKKGENPENGIPLAKWAEVASNVDFLSQLRSFGFFTVEDMANMPDSAQRLFHGSLTWKLKAKRYLEEQNKLKAADEEKAEADAKDQQIAELSARLAALEKATEPKKRGRPPKNKEA